jgi:hypothetical protein
LSPTLSIGYSFVKRLVLKGFRNFTPSILRPR